MPPITRRLAMLSPLAAALAPTAARAALRHQVTIRQMRFEPSRLTIGAGDTVTWVNRDTARHTATDTGGRWGTGVLRPGAAGTVTFATPGTYDYACALHPSMRGRITVT